MMVASADVSTQIAPKSLEELSRHLRRERIKLERNLSDGRDEIQQSSEKEDAQIQQIPATGEKTMDEMFDYAKVNNSLEEESTKTVTKIDAESKQGESSNDNGANKASNNISQWSPPPSFSSDTEESKSSEAETASRSISDGADSPILTDSPMLTQVPKPKNRSKPVIPRATRQIGLISVRQVKQRYDKLKSMQRKPRVPVPSNDDLWLIRQTPKISGSYPDDEVSVYPDTMSVMSIDTQIRSNILTVEEVINEEGRTCYVI
mmetsp:Transcript_43598/g.105184  ORF Transcript_43598/g.105184 Transcript_43598/m.105184 type:complete len:262 (-) Transcript_43598:62-847(-)|eukprot:CAMPEP_0113631186 /NCGR_PEP_ID=MMETSP0017_2-20120614/16206_1 /TAXON_ID=2856 /ORGANISM="Cylindrotheca closterium" /LENGTH=261 /DNA_ID=CAMNT_0000541685 /DNA_START=51 /DNA_END=836 /DNA_ORIENTATION=- /assembly_acc=CAM_ASM_000147